MPDDNEAATAAQVALEADDTRRQEIGALNLPAELDRYFRVRGLSVAEAEAANTALAENGYWLSADGGYEVYSRRDT
jgi:hypothetical protein